MVEDAEPRSGAIYARVSTDEQTKGSSLEVQVDRCRAVFVAEGVSLVGEFVDRGVSGALSSRPGLDALVRLVEDGELDIVAITKLDRIARSLRHLLDLLDLLERHNVTLVALDDPLDPSTASGRAMVHLRGVFAELERQLIRERTTDGLRRRVESGGWPGGPAPYGYQIVDNPHGPGRVLDVEEEEAAVIRLAYKLIAEDGCTTGEAAVELNRLGTQPRRAPVWTHWIVRRLLLEGRGISGRWPWRRAGRDGRGPADEIIVNVPPILDTNEHERLLAALATTSTQPSGRRRYLLRGRLLSPHGVRMHGVVGRGGIRWYRCAYRRLSQRPAEADRCDCRRLHADTVEHAVWEHVVALLGDPAALESLATEYETTRGQHSAREREQLADLDSRITTMEVEIAEEYAALRDEGFDPVASRAAIRKRNDRLAALNQQRSMLLRFRAKNMAAAGLAPRLRALAAEASATLSDADDALRRKVFDLLDLRVAVKGWDECPTCKARGLLARPEPRRYNVGAGDDRRHNPLVCPDCLRTRYIPVVHIAGQVPELVLLALAGKGDLAQLTADAGSALSFHADVRVA